MKKTVTANISGIVFHIDEDAYKKLQQYLSLLEEHFTNSDGKDEILSDLENRIAEMFQEKLNSSKKVITIRDVNEVISQLGEPEQIGNPEEEDKKETSDYSSGSGEKTAKRLFRDPDNKYIAGVSGGLGAFFNIDSTWIRVAFVVFTFFYGFGPLLYIILWIAVPKAVTTAEKLEMRGEKVNLSNIERSIKEELTDLKENIKEFSEETRRNLKKKSGDINRDFKESGVINFLKKTTGVLVVFIAAVILVTFISLGFFLPYNLDFAQEYQNIYPLWDYLENAAFSQIFLIMGFSGLALVIIIPLIWLVIAGFQLIFEFKGNFRISGVLSFILWFIGLGLLLIFATNFIMFHVM